jgi:hypothetical protein
LENDIKKAIELSLKPDSSKNIEELSDTCSATTSSSSTSKLTNSNNSFTNIPLNSNSNVKMINNNNNNSNNSNKSSSSKQCVTTVIPYDTLFLNSANDNNISILIKNMEMVLCDKTDKEKIEKVCNFQVKIKK